ncbi:hypothetical protein BD770DRAFT_413052 [Pilaira anomala]|nr:hypothetical protein BD770DRAFT_413052 [Pilaira anomala]
MLPSWVWIIVAIALLFLLLISSYIVYRKKKTNKKPKDIEKQQEVYIHSPTPTTIEQTVKPEQEDRTSILYGQQFVVVEPSQTALSPPPQQRERKISTTTTILQQDENEGTIEPQKSRGVFSLSPPHEETDSIQDTSNCSTTTRTITPCHTINTSSWRGPTPPWTQSNK